MYSMHCLLYSMFVLMFSLLFHMFLDCLYMLDYLLYDRLDYMLLLHMLTTHLYSILVFIFSLILYILVNLHYRLSLFHPKYSLDYSQNHNMRDFLTMFKLLDPILFHSMFE